MRDERDIEFGEFPDIPASEIIGGCNMGVVPSTQPNNTDYGAEKLDMTFKNNGACVGVDPLLFSLQGVKVCEKLKRPVISARW